MVSSISPGLLRNQEPARLDVPHRRLPKEPAVLPIELTRALVPNLKGGACSIHSYLEKMAGR